MSSADITFNQIPASQRTPGKYFEYDTTGAVSTLPNNPNTVLVIGQRLASGSVLANVPTPIFSTDDAATYFGEGSMLHAMIVAALTSNQYVTMTAIAVDDAAAGVAATGTLTLAGPAAQDGSITLAIANEPVQIAVNSGDTAAAIATALAAQIAQQPDLQVTAAVNAQTPAMITITAKNKGAAANAISLNFTSQASGVTGTLVAMSGGQNDPDLSAALATVYGGSYTMYVVPYSTQAALLELATQLNEIAGPLEQRPATGYAGWVGTYAQGTTLSAAINSGRISIAWHNGSQLTPWQVAAAYTSAISAESDPSEPLNTVAMTGLDATPASAWPGRNEVELALWNGLTPLKVGPGSVVQIVRAITTYLVNANGVADPALLDLETIRTMDYCAYAWRQRIELRFPRAKNDAKTAARVRSELLDVAYELQAAEIIQNVDEYKDNFLVEQDLQDPTRLNASIPCNVVSGLYIFAAKINLIL